MKQLVMAGLMEKSRTHMKVWMVNQGKHNREDILIEPPDGEDLERVHGVLVMLIGYSCDARLGPSRE